MIFKILFCFYFHDLEFIDNMTLGCLKSVVYCYYCLALKKRSQIVATVYFWNINNHGMAAHGLP